jgi:hypothetical protein
MARQEHYMTLRLGLKAAMTVLDVSCGFGGPATEIAKFADCKVVGLNINAYQLQKGKEIAAAQDVGEDIMELVQSDFLVCICTCVSWQVLTQKRRRFHIRITHSTQYTRLKRPYTPRACKLPTQKSIASSSPVVDTASMNKSWLVPYSIPPTRVMSLYDTKWSAATVFRVRGHRTKHKMR